MGNIQNKFFALFSRRKAKQNSKSTQIYNTNSATAQTSPTRIFEQDYNDNFTALTPALISAIKERLQRDSDLKQAQQWKEDANLPSGLVPYSRPNFEEVDSHPEEQMEEIEEASLHPTRLTLKRIAEAKRNSNNNNRQFVKVFQDDIETLKPTKVTKASNPKRSRGRSVKKKLLQFTDYQITPGGIRLRNPPSRQLYVNPLTLEGQGKKKKNKAKKSSDNNKKEGKETWVEHLEANSHDHDNGSYCSDCFECNPIQRNPVVDGANVWGKNYYSQAPNNKPEKGILKNKGNTKVLSALSLLGSKGEQQLEQGWKDFGTIKNTNGKRSKPRYFNNKNSGKSPNFPHYQNLPGADEKIESSAQLSLLKWVAELHEKERLRKEQIPRIMAPVKGRQQMVTNYDELDEEEEFDEYARLRSKERKLKRQQEYDYHLAMPR